MAVEDDAYRYAIKNAFLHSGKADVGAVVGKVKALYPEIELRTAMQIIIEAVKKVNAMEKKEIEAEYKKFEKQGYELKPKEKESQLPELEWAEKEVVVTRYAPNPNGPFHLGNARAAVLSDEFAKIYGGKMLLRFDDTDPKVKKPIADAEKIFKEDLKWLGCDVSETFFASDRLDIYYKYMKKLVEKGKGYICECESEKWRKLIRQKQGCECRELDAKKQMQKLEKMFSHEFKEGQAVLRVKTDLHNPDPSVRDWWAAKIVDEPEHPRVKGKHIWPSYNFASAIDDHLLGITLILRGQEHAQNETKQEFLYQYFGWQYPHSFHFGRIKLEGMVLSTSKIKAGIEEGIYDRWDDSRLGTIRALRRRGFQAKALREAILDVGVKSTDAQIDGKRLADLNKTAVGDVGRVFFIRKPIRLDVDYAPEKAVELDGKKVRLKQGTQSFVVDRETMELFREGKAFRLRNAYNVRVEKTQELQVFAKFIGEEKLKLAVVPWLLEGKSMDVTIVMPDGNRVAGIAGEELSAKRKGEIAYLDKFGFCRVDETQQEKAVLWFAHK